MLYIQTPKNIIIGCIYKHPKTSYMLYIQTPKKIIIGCK